MISVNEYFEGKVKSMAVEQSSGKSTIGVMEAGVYEFGTATVEIMHVVKGSMDVKLPGSEAYITVKEGENFRVEKDQKFMVKLFEPTAYLCEYL